MEVRLVTKNPKTKRFNNVEIYSEEEFLSLVYIKVAKVLEKKKWYQRLNVVNICDNVAESLRVEFKERLKTNKNK